MSPYQINQEGYYGEFGGAYVPEILHKCVSELQHAYLNVIPVSRKSFTNCSKIT